MTLSTVPDPAGLPDVWAALPDRNARTANFDRHTCMPRDLIRGTLVEAGDGGRLWRVANTLTTRHMVTVVLHGHAGARLPRGVAVAVWTWRRLTRAQLDGIDAAAGGDGIAELASRKSSTTITPRTARTLELRGLVVIGVSQVRLTDAGTAAYIAHRDVVAR